MVIAFSLVGWEAIRLEGWEAGKNGSWGVQMLEVRKLRS